MALTYLEVARQTMGNRVLVCYSVKGDASETSVTAKAMKLQRIDCAWLSDVDDAAELTLTTWKGSAIVTSAAIGSGQYQLVFAIGF